MHTHIYVPHFPYAFICPWTFRLLPCLGYYNSAAVNTGVHISFHIRVFIFSGYVSRSRIAGSYGNCFCFLRNLHTILPSGCTDLHSHQPFGGFRFLHILASICNLQTYGDDHSDTCEVIPYFSFDFHFCNNQMKQLPIMVSNKDVLIWQQKLT